MINKKTGEIKQNSDLDWSHDLSYDFDEIIDYKCDRCGIVASGLEYEKWEEVKYHWDHVIFNGINKLHLGDFCFQCAIEITPHVITIRDIKELSRYLYRLKRNINERQKFENDRSTADFTS